MDDNIFEAIDPEGRRVVCTRLKWIDHICNPKKGRAYLLDSEEDIQEFIATVNSPDEFPGICIDRDYPNRLVYMKKHRSGEYYNRVVVEFEDSSYSSLGFVQTAFQPDEIRDGDKPLWLSRQD